jgi:hypothetical protein
VDCDILGADVEPLNRPARGAVRIRFEVVLAEKDGGDRALVGVAVSGRDDVTPVDERAAAGPHRPADVVLDAEGSHERVAAALGVFPSDEESAEIRNIE